MHVDKLHKALYIIFIKDLIRQAEEKLCFLESVLYSRQHPVRDKPEQRSSSAMLKLQKCACELEERLSGLVEHAKMLTNLKKEFETFHHGTSTFLDECLKLIDEITSIDGGRSEIGNFEDIEVRVSSNK